MENEHDLAKWLAGEMTDAERTAFEQTPGFALYEKIASASTRLKAPGFDGEKMLGHITSLPKKQQKPKVIPLYRKAALRIAAVLVVGIGIWFGINKGKENDITVAQTAAGTTKTLTLPDLSEVTLNSGSVLSYAAEGWDAKRQAHLEGEAFFHVSKGKTFDVVTDLGKVTVVGTQFNVKVRSQRFEVACFEGKVRVRSGNHNRLITKGEIVAFEGGKSLEILPESTATPGWMQNTLVFKSESLPEIIAELERHFALRISFEGQYPKALFTGMLPGNDPSAALELVCNTYKLRVVKQQGSTIKLSPAAL